MMFARFVSGLSVALIVVASGSVCLAAEAHGEAGGGSINPLSLDQIQGDLALWTAVVFLLLLAVLWRFAWGPLAKGLDKREQAIADQISEAERSNREAKELLGQYEQKLADAKSDVRGILDKGRRDAEQLAREMQDKARQDARAEQQRALEQIDAATTNALKELAARSSTLAVELAGKILQAELKPEDHRRLIDQAVAGFRRQTAPEGDASRN